ncbi:TPA: hypothetical protein ACH3X1_002543 [Trebouxia sp. C0004]
MVSICTRMHLRSKRNEQTDLFALEQQQQSCVVCDLRCSTMSKSTSATESLIATAAINAHLGLQSALFAQRVRPKVSQPGSFVMYNCLAVECFLEVVTKAFAPNEQERPQSC